MRTYGQIAAEEDDRDNKARETGRKHVCSKCG